MHYLLDNEPFFDNLTQAIERRPRSPELSKHPWAKMLTSPPSSVEAKR
jgi:hypothetical protein